jgi:tetratricopeptide (TPR) repeat protein
MIKTEKSKIENALSNLEQTEDRINFLRNLLEDKGISKELERFLNHRFEGLCIDHYKENYKDPQKSIDFYASLGKRDATKIAEMFRKYNDPSVASHILQKIGDYSGAIKIWEELKQPVMVAQIREKQGELETNKLKKRIHFLKAAEIYEKIGEKERANENYKKAGFLEYIKSKFK